MKNELVRIGWTDLCIDFNETFWLEGIWKQLEKDALMSGLSSFPTALPGSFDAMIDVLEPFISGLKNNKREWDAFVYRVDLPSGLDVWTMSIPEAVRLFILRSFQKVWLRTYYSPNKAKVIRKARKNP